MKFKTIVPNYYNKFKCSGSECKNTCCKDWRIGLKKNEYFDTKKIIDREGSLELKAISQNAFQRVRESGLGYYEVIRLNEKGYCPFFGKDGLCILQKEFGEDILSNTCRGYPRRALFYLDYSEVYLCNSCETVVKLFMDLPEGIEFKEGEKLTVEQLPIKGSIITQQEATERPYKFYWDIKTLVMRIMKNRRYSIEDRLILLCIAFQKIDGFISSNEDNKVAPYINSFVKLAEERTDLISSASKIKPDRSKNIKLAAQNLIILASRKIIDRDFFIKISDNYGIKYISQNEKSENSELKRSISMDTSEINFTERRNMLCEYFSKDREYILENIMLNTMLYLNLPFRNPKLSFTENHFFICLYYNTLMFALAGYINNSDDSDSIVEGTAMFSRGFMHFSKEEEVIEKTFAEYHINSLKEMISLIKF